jgi:hypothetical protein
MSLPRAALHLIPIFALSTAQWLPSRQVAASIESSASYVYGQQVDYRVAINDERHAARATVFVRRPGFEETLVIQATLNGGQLQIAHAVQNLALAPIKPFTQVEYWWQLDFEDGSSLTTDPVPFDYLDNRYQWQSITQIGIRVHWINGDPAFGQAVLDRALLSAGALQRNLGLAAPSNLQAYVYPDLASLQSSLQLGGASWIGGHAEPDLGVLLLAASPDDEGLLLLERSLPHELTHLVLYQRMQAGYENLPAWLNEGLATLQEGAPDASGRLLLEQAASTGELIPLTSLCAPFPDSGQAAQLAYAQSAAVVQYIRDIYGTGAIAALLDAYQEGTSCSGGVERTLRRSMQTLDAEWRRSAFPGLSPLSQFEAGSPWLLLAMPALVVFLLAVAMARRRRHAESNASGRR